MLVVDASFAVAAAMTREGLGRLQGREAVAPALLWSEATSVLHELLWRKTISAELAKTAFETLRHAPIRLRQPGRLLEEAWQVANRLGWAKTYDAEYLALARLLHCPLLTIDARLTRAGGLEAEILGPSDL
jgi:predicted nucleic acid-binding protein